VRRPAVAGVFLLLALGAQAGELQRAGADLKSLVTAPLHWRAREWKRFGEGVALVVAAGAADKQIEDAFQRNRSSSTNSFAKAITPFGGGRGLELSAVLFGAGKLFHDANVENAGRDALEADLWAGGVVTPLLKDAFGRARPNINEGTYNFHFAQTDNPHNSFPSGHATSAFALATAIAGHYDNWVVPTIVYTIASGVAASRLNDHVHWPSDVVAGALIGRAVAKGVLARHAQVRISFFVVPPGARHISRR
jgi:membrane-associated phospholipid phosphatase